MTYKGFSAFWVGCFLELNLHLHGGLLLALMGHSLVAEG